MTLDDLISDLQMIRNKIGEDTPIRVVINDNDLGSQLKSFSRDLVINNNLSAALTYKFPHAIRSQSQFRYVSGAI